jgi:putative transposase
MSAEKTEPLDSLEGYWSDTHTHHRLRYHIVLVPKNPRLLLTGAIALRLEALLSQACEVNRWEMEELSLKEDHVDLLLQVSPDDSLSKVVNCLKGGSNRVIRDEFPYLEEFLWGKTLWKSGFFAETIGPSDEIVYTMIRRYIQEQSRQH